MNNRKKGSLSFKGVIGEPRSLDVSNAFQSLVDRIVHQHLKELLAKERRIQRFQAEVEKLKQDLDPDGSAVGHVNSHLSHLSRLSKPSRQGRVRKSGGKPSSAKKMQAADLLGALDITPSQERESPYDVFRANSFDRSNRSEQDDSYETDTGLFDSRPWHERFASRLQSTAFEGIIAVALFLNVLWMAAQLQVWVAVKELKLSYYIGETLLFTIYTHYGNLNPKPQTLYNPIIVVSMFFSIIPIYTHYGNPKPSRVQHGPFVHVRYCRHFGLRSTPLSRATHSI